METLPVPGLLDLVHRARSTGQRQSEEVLLGERTVLCSAALMAEGAGLVVLLHDTSEIHRVEAVKRDFVANASHELRTPLTTIRGSLEMLEGSSCGTEADRWIEAIRRNAQRMTAIVEDLLLLSRLEAKEAGLEPQGITGSNDPLDDSCLASSRPARDDQNALLQGQLDGVPLSLRKGYPHLSFQLTQESRREDLLCLSPLSAKKG